MDEKFNSILSIALIPQTVDLIVKNEGLDDISAMNEFYHSKTYEMLSNEETKMWHFSPIAIFDMWENEVITGDPRNSLYLRGEEIE